MDKAWDIALLRDDWALAGMTFTTILAIWGAALSTVLGLVQLDDRRVKVQLDLEPRPIGHGGNKIEIHNLSNKAVQIRHWELFALTGHLWLKERRNIESAVDLTGSFRIGAHDGRTLTFDDAYQFYVEDDERLYFRMYVAGTLRRSICRRLRT